MPLRARMKRAFGRDSPEEGSDPPKKEKKQKLPDNTYKPGEPMPRPKYRGPWDKEHQDKLTNFSFTNAFSRRKSEQSQYSPMGSRLPSRRGSFLHVGRKSLARSRQHSTVDPALVEATEGDDNVANVGVSRQHTREEIKRPRTRDSVKKPQTADSVKMDPLQEIPTVTNGSTNFDGDTNALVDRLNYGKPFTDDELTQAMSKSTLRSPMAGRA